MPGPRAPDFAVGELVVLRTEEKSSVEIIVSYHRGFDAGDKLQGE